jgi:hypothetical protein
MAGADKRLVLRRRCSTVPFSDTPETIYYKKRAVTQNDDEGGVDITTEANNV